MTTLSIRAISELVRRHVREHGAVYLGDMIRWLRDLELPEDRARAGIARAVESGHLRVEQPDHAACSRGRRQRPLADRAAGEQRRTARRQQSPASGGHTLHRTE